MTRAQSPNTADEVAQRLRVRYGKQGRLRFASHRDFARTLERALRRSGVRVAYSGGFTPHPRISYQGAAPTGVASEAEYLELGLSVPADPVDVGRRLAAEMPDGFVIHEVVVAGSGGVLAERLQASLWEVRVAAPLDRIAPACAAFLQATEVPVIRLTKDGRREIDVRAPVVSLVARAPVPDKGDPADGGSAILSAVVRHVTPTVRPDDLVAGICAVSGLVVDLPIAATRLRQGVLGPDGGVTDPLAADRP